MKKLTNKQKERLQLPAGETYYNLDGFIYQHVDSVDVYDLACMDKEVFQLFDDDTERLVELNEVIDIDGWEVYGIEVGFLDELERASTFRQINHNLGIK
jgi:hypothetical protein